MEPTSPVSTKAIRDALKPQQSAPTAMRVSTLDAPRRAQGFFRRAQPTTFQRCLAVHMHFAQHASALD